MGGLGDFFGGLGELFGGALESAEAAATAAEVVGAVRGGETPSATETYDRTLAGGRRVLNVNDR